MSNYQLLDNANTPQTIGSYLYFSVLQCCTKGCHQLKTLIIDDDSNNTLQVFVSPTAPSRDTQTEVFSFIQTCVITGYSSSNIPAVPT